MGFDKTQVARQFSRAAATYDDYAELQRRMASRLIADLPAGAAGTLVDLGCGTGAALQQLGECGSWQRQVGIDLAPGMIELAARRYGDDQVEWICGDLEQTSLPSGWVDVLFSNTALQWCNLTQAAAEFSRLLKPQGTLLLSTFGPATLRQWRQAWRSLGESDPPVHQFESVATVVQTLEQHGILPSRAESELVDVSFADIDSMLASVKGIGATFAGTDRSKRLFSKSKYQRFRHSLAESSLVDQRYRLTYECIFVTGSRIG